MNLSILPLTRAWSSEIRVFGDGSRNGMRSTTLYTYLMLQSNYTPKTSSIVNRPIRQPTNKACPCPLGNSHGSFPLAAPPDFTTPKNRLLASPSTVAYPFYSVQVTLRQQLSRHSYQPIAMEALNTDIRPS